MKQHNRFTKRFLALFLVLCFVLGQINLPAGLIKVSPDFSFLHTKAAGETFTISSTNRYYPIMYKITGSNTVTATSYDVDALNAHPSNHILFFADDNGTITHPTTGKKYTVTAIDGDFGGLSMATAVVIPKTVISIGDSAFARNQGIEALYFQKDSQCQTIGKRAFYNCTHLLSSNLQDCKDYASNIDSSSYSDTSCNPDTKDAIKILSFPPSMQSIGEEAFSQCSGLKHVDFEGEATNLDTNAFGNCSKLITAKLSQKATSIGASAFENCGDLVAVTIPNEITEIKDKTFNSCTKLCSLDVAAQRTSLVNKDNNQSIDTELTIPTKVTKIGSYAFAKTQFTVLTPSAALTSIGSHAFENSSLNNIEFEAAEQLTTIGDYAFASCGNLGGTLKGDTIYYWIIAPPDTLTTIGKYAFSGCSQLCHFRFASGTNITTIDEGAFSSSGINSFSLPDTITEISNKLFQNCGSLDMVSISRDLTTIGDYAFQNASKFTLLQTRNGKYSGYAGTDENAKPLNTPDEDLSNSKINKIGAYSFQGTNFASFDLPAGVTMIPEGAFNTCSQMTEFTFHGSTLEFIGTLAFAKCSALKTITIPGGIEGDNLGAQIFQMCTDLTSVTFADDTTFTSVTTSMFEGCSKLKEFRLPSTVTTIESNAFKDCSTLKTVYNIASVTAIRQSAFENCTSFIGFDLPDSNTSHDLSLPETLMSLDGSAFAGCSSIQSVKEMGFITIIPTSAFKNCTALAEIVIPSSVKTISAEAFINAPIVKMTFLTTKAPTLQSVQKPCFSSTIATNVTISCYVDVKDALSDNFKNIGIIIPSNRFQTMERPGQEVYQVVDSITNLTVGKTQTLKKGTDYGSKASDGSESSDVFSWISSDPSIVAVDASVANTVKITALDVGTAIVTGSTKNGSVTYTITIKPSTANVIDNPYEANYVIYDITNTSDLSEAPVVYSGDSDIPKTADYLPYLYGNVTDGKTITLKVVGKHSGNVTTDKFYWSTTATDAIELGTAGNSVEAFIGEQKNIIGDTVTVTPLISTESMASSTKAKIDITTKMARKSTIEYTIGNKLTALEYGTKAPNGEIMVAVNSSMNINGNQYIKKEPASSLEKIIWSLRNEGDSDCLTITEDGNITTKNIGTVTVIATSNCSKITKEYTISVINAINKTSITNISEGTSISSNSTINMLPGDSVTLNLSWSYNDEYVDSIDYLNCEVEDAAIAAIESSDKDDDNITINVKAVQMGKTKLSFAPNSGVTTGSGFITINVQQPVESITVKEGSATKAVGVNDTISLKNCFNISPTNHKDTITYESNNTNVATIDSSGVATGVSPGTCFITAKCARNNVSAQITLNVTNTVTAAKATPESIGSTKSDIFYPGASKTISLELTTKNANLAVDNNALVWTSTNPDVATVTGSGTTATVTAVKAGSASIKVTNALGTNLCSIPVKVSSPTIKLDRSSVTLYKKIKKRKTYTIKPIIAGNSKATRYSSSKSSVASVSSSGKVTAKKKGTAVITVTANGVSAKLNITVDTKTKAKLTVGNSGGIVKKNKLTVKKSLKQCRATYQASWQVLSATYKSSKKKVASIDKKGNIKLKKKGTTKITITVDGMKKTYTLRVK